MPDFDAYEFLRRFDAGEFDLSLPKEIANLTESELEQLALIVTNNMRAKSSGVG